MSEFTPTVDEMKRLLIERGWHTWYNEDYWVHKKLVDSRFQDYTHHGMSLLSAYRKEFFK